MGIAIGAVFIVLCIGLFTFFKSSSEPGAGSRSNQLMRWRVILQFIAVCVMVLAMYLKSKTA
ncbi:MAG: twin transmembrane helix small protein [Pseudomonadota bacterium]